MTQALKCITSFIKYWQKQNKRKQNKTKQNKNKQTNKQTNQPVKMKRKAKRRCKHDIIAKRRCKDDVIYSVWYGQDKLKTGNFGRNMWKATFNIGWNFLDR